MAQPIRSALLGLALAGAVWAQPLRPGDHLEIRVFSLPGCDQRYVIGPNGFLSHPVAGEFQTSGKTLEQLRNFLRRQFKHSLRKPEFSLRLETPGSDSEVAVLGEVQHQGSFPFAAGARWTDLLRWAGGATEKADMELAVILRGDRELPVTDDDLEVLPSDVLYVPLGKRVTISGEVTNPGQYCLSRSRSSLEELLARAGGVNQSVWHPRFLIVRPHLKQPLEVAATSNEKLGDGDTVWVMPRLCRLTGLVRSPGYYQLKGNDTLAGIVAECRISSARVDRVTVERAKGRTQEVYDLEADDLGVPIFEGDIIWVPDSAAPSRQDAQIERLNVPGALDLYRSFSF